MSDSIFEAVAKAQGTLDQFAARAENPVEDPAARQASGDFLAIFGPVVDAMAKLLDAAYMEPCHDQPHRGPQHFMREDYCATMKEAVAARMIGTLDLDYTTLPRRMHENCYTCHPVEKGNKLPSQEVPRQRLREVYEWAGITPPSELLEPGTDEVQAGDTAKVLAALTDEFETWQHVTKLLAPGEPEGYFSSTRYWKVVNALEAEGRVQRRDIATRLTPKSA